MTKRYGVIGCGMMGREHIQNLNLLDGAEVAYLYDPVPECAAEAAALAGSAEIVWSIAEMLERSDLDALIIASPNYLHAGQLQQIAARHSLPILCEKPLFTDPADDATIRALQNTYAAPIWVAMEYRYMPPLKAFIDQVDTVAGQIDMLTLREHRYPFLKKVGNWNRLNRLSGGTLVEKCCHFFDLMRLILKTEPVRVMASAGQRNNHLNEVCQGQAADIWDTAFVIFEFESGARALLDLCMYADGSVWNEEITAVGRDGKIECRIPGPPRFWPDSLPEPPEPELVLSPRAPIGPTTQRFSLDQTLQDAGDHHGSTFYQHQKFLDLVCGRLVEAEVSLEDGLRAVKMGLAAQESARTHQMIEL